MYPSQDGFHDQKTNSLEITSKEFSDDSFDYFDPQPVITTQQTETSTTPAFYIRPVNKNLLRFFMTIATQKKIIKTDLTRKEIQEVMDLEEINKNVISNIQKEQIAEYKQENLKTDKNNADKKFQSKEIQTYEELELSSKLDEENFIQRDELIKFLKYEKEKLRNRRKKKHDQKYPK